MKALDQLRKRADSSAKGIDSYNGGENDHRFDMGPRSSMEGGPETPSTTVPTGQPDEGLDETTAMEGMKLAGIRGLRKMAESLSSTPPDPTAPSSSSGVPETPSQAVLTGNTLKPSKLPFQEQSQRAQLKFQFPQQFNRPVLRR